MKFGDFVEMTIGKARGTGFVIGVPSYSKGYDDIVVIADATHMALPVHAAWCKEKAFPTAFISPSAQTLRERYLEKFPGALKEETL